MALFDAWYQAIVVPDTNALLKEFRRAPAESSELLEILEKLSNKIWIPRQFWNEYQRRIPEIRNDISKEYRTVGGNLQSYRDKTKNTLIHLSDRYSLVIAGYIPQINELFHDIISDVLNSSKEHIKSFFEHDIDVRIARLLDGNVGDPFPQSRLDSIYTEGKFRYDNKIPPGFKDIRKSEPDCYGDLVAWKQIIEYADEIKRPVIMITDDSSGEDWFYKSKGEPSGPRRELVQEIHDEAGVDFYLYTSEQFLQLARMYLKSRAMAEAAGEYFRRLTPTLLPDFGKIVATGSLSALAARVGIFNDFRHSLKALSGLTAGVTNKGLLDSISAVTAFSDRYNHSFSTLAGLTTNDSLKYIVDQLSSTAAVLKPYAELYRSTAHYMNSIREQQRIIADIVNPIREQQRMIADIVNPIREQQRMITDIVNPIREQQRMIADIVNPIREQQRMIADIVNPMREQQRMIADIVNPFREQQRMIADIVKPMREQQRTIDMFTKPMLSDVTKNSMLSISGIAKDLTPSVNDSNSLMKQFREE